MKLDFAFAGPRVSRAFGAARSRKARAGDPFYGETLFKIPLLKELLAFIGSRQLAVLYSFVFNDVPKLKNGKQRAM